MAVKDVTLEDLDRRLSNVERNMATKADLDGLEGRLNERMDGLEGRLNERMDGLKKEILEALQRGFTSNY